MIAGNEKNRRVLVAASLERFRQALPEIRAGIRIVKDIANAEDCIYGVPARDVEDSPNYIHTGARQLLLPLFRERRKTSSEMPIRSMQKPQHDVSGFGTWIRNTDWNSRFTVGVR
jgi:hypothetical protein